jgi:hypothetical protein
MTYAVELPALDGRDPLGFLASLGLLHVIAATHGPNVRLAFSAETGGAILHSPLAGVKAIAATLAEVVARTGDGCAIAEAGAGFPLRKASRKTARETGAAGHSDPMRVPRDGFRKLLASVEGLGSPAAVTWLAVLVTDLAVDRQNRTALTLYTAPSGQQSLWTFFEKPLTAVRAEPERLAEALTGWRRIDGFTGEYLDHRVLRSAADHPAGRSVEAGVPGATWLATQALPLLRLTGDGHTPAATMWHRLGRRNLMIWPLWRPALDKHAIIVLLEHPLLRPTPVNGTSSSPEPRVDRRKLKPLGAFEVCGAERQLIEGRKNAGVLAPITVQ